VRVQIRASRRQEYRFHATSLQQPVERLRVFGVPIVQQTSLPHEKSVKRIRQLSRTLLHEGRGRMWRDPGDFDLPRG
jgi:hypothetical protein